MSDLGTSDPVVLQFQQTRTYTKAEVMEYRAANPLVYNPDFFRTPPSVIISSKNILEKKA